MLVQEVVQGFARLALAELLLISLLLCPPLALRLLSCIVSVLSLPLLRPLVADDLLHLFWGDLHLHFPLHLLCDEVDEGELGGALWSGLSCCAEVQPELLLHILAELRRFR